MISRMVKAWIDLEWNTRTIWTRRWTRLRAANSGYRGMMHYRMGSDSAPDRIAAIRGLLADDPNLAEVLSDRGVRRYSRSGSASVRMPSGTGCPRTYPISRRCAQAATGATGTLRSRARAGTRCAPSTEPPRAQSRDDLPLHRRPSGAAHAHARAVPIRAGPHDRSVQRPVPEARKSPGRRLRACVRSPA